MGIELSKRPYIIVGMLGFVCLFLLAITSNRFAMRKLGSRWKKLHRLVYLILGGGAAHARGGGGGAEGGGARGGGGGARLWRRPPPPPPPPPPRPTPPFCF